MRAKNMNIYPMKFPLDMPRRKKRLKGREGGALLPKFLKERLKTKTGIFRGLEFKPNQTYNLGIFL